MPMFGHVWTIASGSWKQSWSTVCENLWDNVRICEIFFWHSWTSFCNWDMLANKLFNIFWLPCGEVRHAANLKSRAQETDSMRRLKQKRRIICQWQKMTIRFGQLLTIYILFDVFSCTHVRTMMDICFWSCIEFLALSCASLPIHAHASGTQVCFWCCSHSTGSHSTEVLPKLRSWFAKICEDSKIFWHILLYPLLSLNFECWNSASANICNHAVAEDVRKCNGKPGDTVWDNKLNLWRVKCLWSTASVSNIEPSCCFQWLLHVCIRCTTGLLRGDGSIRGSWHEGIMWLASFGALGAWHVGVSVLIVTWWVEGLPECIFDEELGLTQSSYIFLFWFVLYIIVIP